MNIRLSTILFILGFISIVVVTYDGITNGFYTNDIYRLGVRAMPALAFMGAIIIYITEPNEA